MTKAMSANPQTEPAVAATPATQPPTAAAPKEPPKLGSISQFWLRRLFYLARNMPWMARFLKPAAAVIAIRWFSKPRKAAFANSRRIISPTIPESESIEFGRDVIRRFIEFVLDVGLSHGQTPEQMRARIDGVEGHDHYVAARKHKRGAIILTAHMGSFELGLAALTAIEPNVHVVFKRDTQDGFEIIRQSLRRTLGVHEAPIDDGWTTWLKLRDALRADHVVILQGDRTMPGQKSQAVPIAGGHVALPLGPLTLALASGAPIVPIFTLATTLGHGKVFVEPAIHVDPEAVPVNGVHPAMLQIAAALEKYVVAHPTQWLLLDPAFVEDQVPA